MQVRKIVLDTETTGLSVRNGHRVIEIGCVEIIDDKVTGKTYQKYLNPKRKIDTGAYRVHGISEKFLADKPEFKEIANEFVEFIKGSEVIIHNAPFDVGFLNHELESLGLKPLNAYCKVTDTLPLARKLPLDRHRLDDLCEHYGVDTSNRKIHGALKDSVLLAEVYLALKKDLAGEYKVPVVEAKEVAKQMQSHALIGARMTRSQAKLHDVPMAVSTSVAQSEQKPVLMDETPDAIIPAQVTRPGMRFGAV